MPRVILKGDNLLRLPKRFRRTPRSAQQSAVARAEAQERSREKTASFYARTHGKGSKRKKRK